MNYLLDALKQHAQKKPDALFLVDADMCYSFSEFYEAVGKLSTFLLTQGVQNGDFVVVHLSKKSEHLITYIALLNIGAICVHLYPEREDEYVIFAANHTDAKAIISNTFTQEVQGKLVFDFPKNNTLQPTYTHDYNEIAYVMFTSGTTSTPKAVLTTHENINFVTHTLIDLADMQKDIGREIILLPLGSTGGLGHFHASLFLGNQIYLFKGFYSKLTDVDIEQLLSEIQEKNITGILLTPGLVKRLLYHHQEKFQTCAKNLKYVLTNVSPMKKETIKTLLDLLPNLRFCTYYGSTEASRSIVNICRENGEFMHLTGKPAHGVSIEIRNKNENGEGEIYIKGANVMQGYLGIENSLNDGWFASGDIAREDENGYISVLGRVNDTINVDGLKLFPMELENIAMSHPNIDEAGVCALEADFQTVLGFALVLKNKLLDKHTVAQEIFNTLVKHFKMDQTDLYSFKLPNKLYFVDQIPKQGLGKIDRNTLKELLKNSQNTVTYKG
ncbi:class I adenylate-forming enzyme family protein [Sulfurimonas sp.]|uniref:class I adenylate-forming enzyme family protein n=1 Tax=Sulfurimonas sp. TaxID=2022749 RepID=UPI003D141E20